MKKIVMIMALAALFLPVKNTYGADPEVVDVQLGSDIGKSVVNSGYNAEREQDANNPLCFTFTNLLKPTKVFIVGGWHKGTSDELEQFDKVKVKYHVGLEAIHWHTVRKSWRRRPT